MIAMTPTPTPPSSPTWLDTLDIADKLASVAGLIVAIMGLIAAIHFGRKAVREHSPPSPTVNQPQPETDHEGRHQPTQRPAYMFRADPGKEGLMEMIWTAIGLTFGWIITLGGATGGTPGPEGPMIAMSIGYLIIAAATYHTWATFKFYLATGTPVRLGRWLLACVVSLTLAAVPLFIHIATIPGVLK